MKPVTGLELPHCITVARQNCSAMVALRASQHAQTLIVISLYEHRSVHTVRARAKPKITTAAPPAPPVLVLPPALPKVVTETRGDRLANYRLRGLAIGNAVGAGCMGVDYVTVTRRPASTRSTDSDDSGYCNSAAGPCQELEAL